MRFAGIDIASETHVLAMVAADGSVALKATPFTEDDIGYQKALALLGTPGEVLIAMEATGHYWKNLFAVLAAAGHAIALLNPLRTHRFAGADLERTKTDAIDALGIARFAAQKRPAATPLPDTLTEELRELVQLRARLLQDFGDRVRQLHRLVDLGFPEFTRYVRTLDSELASTILRDYPTAAAFRGVSVRRLAALRYDGHHRVGLDLARQLIAAAQRSVGQHHSATYRLQIRYACDDLDTLRRRLRDLDRDLDGKLIAGAPGCWRRFRWCHDRQIHAERRALADRALHLDGPAVRRDDAMADREAEPRALADTLRREERIEDALQVLFRDAAAGIDDRDLDHLDRLGAGIRARRARGRAGCGWRCCRRAPSRAARSPACS